MTSGGSGMSNQEPATILLIDDHPMLRTGVKQLISMAPDITVVGEASNGEQGIELAESLDPDLILLDLNMPGMNGLETLDKLREKSLSGRIVVFSVSNHEEDVVTALKRGADGYLLKDMEPEDLLKALHQAAAGEMVLSEALTPVLAASLRANRATTERDVNQLTPRERDILKLIAQGLPNKMIARRLDITESTVKVHVKHMLKKMKLKSRVEAAVWVHQERIFASGGSGAPPTDVSLGDELHLDGEDVAMAHADALDDFDLDMLGDGDSPGPGFTPHDSAPYGALDMADFEFEQMFTDALGIDEYGGASASGSTGV
nr:NarL-OGR [Cloning vector pMSx65]